MGWGRSDITYIDIRKLFLGIAAVVILAVAVNLYYDWTRVTVMEFSSRELASSWQVSDSEAIKQACRGLSRSTLSGGARPNKDVIVLKLVSRREVRLYMFTTPDIVFDVKNGRSLKAAAQLSRILRVASDELRRRSPFGEMLDWGDVAERFGIGDEAMVKDSDSGKTFHVRRTGGYSHAEIEPLSTKDSAVVKSLYGGRWSWKRRAVVVETGGLKIAGSLVGTPHGTDEIADNDCYGSLGLYFSGRLMERHINLSHLVMIWKAAGRIEEELRGLTPEKTVMVLFTALDQADAKGLRQMVLPSAGNGEIDLTNVIGVTVTGIKKQTDLVYRVSVSLTLASGPYNCPRQVRVRLNKNENTGGYLADADFLGQLLKP